MRSFAPRWAMSSEPLRGRHCSSSATTRRSESAFAQNPKAETRRPKEGRNPKPEGCRERTQGTQRIEFKLCDLCVLLRRFLFSTLSATCESDSDFGLRVSFGLRPSDFGFRISDFPRRAGVTFVLPGGLYK